MPTRIVFDDGLEITVHESEDDVVLAVRRDHPNPVRLRRDGEGRPLYVNWDHVRLIEPGMTAVLERGDASFFYRPRVGAAEVRGLGDVQRFFVILMPDGDRPYRRLIVGRKRLPDPGSHEREWAFVADVTSDASALRADIEAEPRARSAGTAWYALVDHEGHTHLAYVVVRPQAPAALQRELNIRPQASYIAAVRNPDAPAPRGAGLPEHRRAQYPPALRERFGGRRFIPANPPELLDYPGAELVLIGAAEDASPAPDLIRREAPAGARAE